MSTRSRIRRGMLNYEIHFHCRTHPHIIWNSPCFVFITAKHFRTFLCLRERTTFLPRVVGPGQNLDADIDFVTHAAFCLHCRADIVIPSIYTATLSSIDGDSHVTDKTVVRLSCLCNGNPYTGKTGLYIETDPESLRIKNSFENVCEIFTKACRKHQVVIAIQHGTNRDPS